MNIFCTARFIVALPLGILLVFAAGSFSAEPVDTREAWTTSRISGSPEPPLPYVTQRAFPKLKFNQCLDMGQPPGSDRMFVAEQSGKIYSFPVRADVERADLAIDVSATVEGASNVYAIAFHPEFATNRYCYICYIKAPNLADGTHVARFRVSDTNPPKIDPSSETTLLTWLSGGHNGCCLKFGPDGYLYVSTGDAGPANPPDPLKSGQDVSNLLSAILRIDVDATEGEKNYRIPPDNPFVELPGARGEIWAYGLRNPWRMSFDKKTGDLWVGDVGWELWELLDRVERGGNYGWAVMEGNQSTNPEWPRGPTPILPPTIDHPHSESSSITDGLTYYGSRLPELEAVHIYGDYDTGKLWGFKFQDGQVTEHRELGDTTHRIVGFGEDASGEVYLLDHSDGTIHTLIPNPKQDKSADFPRRLSQTGLFDSVAGESPTAGVVPYSVQAEPWADHARTTRFVAVPGSNTVTATGDKYAFPADSVLVKTLSLETVAGKPESRRLIETQILHYDGAEWYPYTYRWNDEQTDAELVGLAGDSLSIRVTDRNGVTRDQHWRFAGRAECQRCHNKWSGPPLGFNTAQLNRSLQAEGESVDQLDSLSQIGLLKQVPAADERPKLADPSDSAATLEERARAYLHTNCGHCHRMHAGSAVLSKMHFDLPLDKTDMIGARPTQGTFGIRRAQVIAAGDPFRSVLLYRTAKLGPGRMPYIGSSEPDLEGLELLHSWIASLKPAAGESDRSHDAVLEKLGRLSGETSPADRDQLLEDVLSSTEGALMLLRALDRDEMSKDAGSQAVALAAQHDQASVRELFERFLPPDQRVQRLGAVVQPQQILELTGSVQAGEALFWRADGVQCRSCHQIGDRGKAIGPELSAVSKRLSREQLLESILQPSKRIEPKYVTHVAEMNDGRLLAGLVIKRDEEQVVLKDAQDKTHTLTLSDVEDLSPQAKSLMPELLLRDLTAQQVADLLSYLESIR